MNRERISDLHQYLRTCWRRGDLHAPLDHHLALLVVGGWGTNLFGQTNVPAPNSGIVAVAAGEYHSVGLKQDGSIVAWGSNDRGQTNVPSPNSGIVAIAAGNEHALAIKVPLIGACCLPGAACSQKTQVECGGTGGTWGGLGTTCETDTDGDGLGDACDPCPSRRTGDVSGDSLVDLGDVAAFTDILLDPENATADDRCAADINQDGEVNGLDMQGFIQLVIP